LTFMASPFASCTVRPSMVKFTALVTSRPSPPPDWPAKERIVCPLPFPTTLKFSLSSTVSVEVRLKVPASNQTALHLGLIRRSCISDCVIFGLIVQSSQSEQECKSWSSSHDWAPTSMAAIRAVPKIRYLKERRFLSDRSMVGHKGLV